MKKQHIHVGMWAPITNKQVRGQPPQSFKAKRFEALPLSNFEKNGPYSRFLMLSSENFGDMISCDILWLSENPDDIPRVCGWYRDKFLLKFWLAHSDDIFRQVRYNPHKLLMMILMISLESYDETLVISTENCRNLR